MGGEWRCVAACKQQTHVSSWARWPTRSESAAGWSPVCHEASVAGGAGGRRARSMPLRASGGLRSAGFSENGHARSQTAATGVKGRPDTQVQA